MAQSADKTSANGGLFYRGVLMHISSLPSKYGVGAIGAEAKRFIERLAKQGADLWAVLPMGPTGYGDSPYQSFSSFALNPYFLDIGSLIKKGYLTAEECGAESFKGKSSYCDYGLLYSTRPALLRKAFGRARLRRGFDAAIESFAERCPEIESYAMFMAIKAEQGGMPWYEWPEELMRREPRAMLEARLRLAEERSFRLFVQMELAEAWRSVKRFAGEHGVRIMGDMPIYCAYDSADCWAHPELFMLDKDMRPGLVAGVPPDYFSELGQRWGNPVYDWEANRREGYAWWLKRLSAAAELYDVLRIDHFRGFESFYAIPAEYPDARIGQWLPACGIKLFRRFAAMQEKGEACPCEIVAEDLGFITPPVKRLLKNTGFAGMKVLEFAFDGSRTNPHIVKKWDGDPSHIINSAVYTGTHDNPPAAAWWYDTDEDTRARALKFAGVRRRDRKRYDMLLPRECGAAAAKEMCRAAVKSSARFVLLPVQDLLGLGEEARMNTPGTENGNWQWRASRKQIGTALETLGEIMRSV